MPLCFIYATVCLDELDDHFVVRTVCDIYQGDRLMARGWAQDSTRDPVFQRIVERWAPQWGLRSAAVHIIEVQRTMAREYAKEALKKMAS